MSVGSRRASAGDFAVGTSIAAAVLAVLFGIIAFSEDIVLAMI